MTELSVGDVFVPNIEVSRLKAAGESELALILELLCDFHGGETIQARQKADLPEFLTSCKVHAFGFYTRVTFIAPFTQESTLHAFTPALTLRKRILHLSRFQCIPPQAAGKPHGRQPENLGGSPSTKAFEPNLTATLGSRYTAQ